MFYIYLHNLSLLFGVTERGMTRGKGRVGEGEQYKKPQQNTNPVSLFANSAHTCTTLR